MPWTVTVYSDADYQGKSQELGVGRYDLRDLNFVGNDSISSIRFNGLLRVKVWEDAGFSGASQIIINDCPNLKSLRTDSSHTHNWNDKISSLEVRERPKDSPIHMIWE